MDKHIEVKSTPAANWRQEGKTDPHNTRYECQRVDLIMGQLTDDEIANAVFLCDHRTSFDSIVYLTAAKDRIRWLSRSNEALIAQLEAAQKGMDDFQRSRDRHHKVSVGLNERLIASEAALSAANEPWRSFVTNDDISALNRFAECCDDPESGGHDLDKDQVERLVSIGALRKTKRNYHETTDFGDFVISAGFTVDGNADAE